MGCGIPVERSPPHGASGRSWCTVPGRPGRPGQGFVGGHQDATLAEVVQVLLVDQWRRHQAGCPRPVEDYLAAVPAIAADPERKLDLVYGDYRAACRFGEPPARSALLARFPDLADA